MAKKVKSKNLVGRYLKTLTDRPHGTPYPKNTYVLIVECTESYVTDINSYSFSYDFAACGMKLMPKTFSPEEIVDVAKVYKALERIVKKRQELSREYDQSVNQLIEVMQQQAQSKK